MNRSRCIKKTTIYFIPYNYGSFQWSFEINTFTSLGVFVKNKIICGRENRKCYSIFNNFELMATMTVLADINTAPIAGLRIIPIPANIPAANGIAIAL
jgi:hypothetical protein